MTIVKKSGLAPGLHFVATPIGNARDITLRALDVLASADVLAAEDTRALRRLMEIHGLSPQDRPLLSYHEHNAARIRPKLLAEMAAGRSVAYASEAGTPMISDPGFDLLRAAQEAGFAATTVPGPSAVIAALTLAGLPTDRFLFAGFLPNATGARKKALAGLADVMATLVFYESPRRLGAMLTDAAEVLGGDREAAVCREITKKFEECQRGALSELAARYLQLSVKGEIVVLLGKGRLEKISEMDLEHSVRTALETMSVRDVADTLSARFGIKRRQVYQLAMALKEKDD